MNCPICGGNTSVMYTLADCETVTRKRKRAECGHIFYTSETENVFSRDEFMSLQREKERARYESKLKGR